MGADWSFSAYRRLHAGIHQLRGYPAGWPPARKLHMAILYSIVLIAVVLWALGRSVGGALPADSVERLDLAGGTTDNAQEHQLLDDLEDADFLHSVW
jgi:hypothetical protein